MASESSQSAEGKFDSSDTNLYPTQRHAGKVGYGPNFSTEGSLVDKLTGLAYEVKGKVTHDPALVHHGHEVFTGEAKRKKILGIDDDDPILESGHDADKKEFNKTQDTSSTSPSTSQTVRSKAPREKAKSVSSGTKSGSERVTHKSDSY